MGLDAPKLEIFELRQLGLASLDGIQKLKGIKKLDLAGLHHHYLDFLCKRSATWAAGSKKTSQTPDCCKPDLASFAVNCCAFCSTYEKLLT